MTKGISKSESKLMTDYMNELLKVNEKINLTRITNPDSAYLLHILDSLAILKDVDDAPEGRYIDLGSGGGFPGVPIAIASHRDTILIDSVKKKMNAVDGILSKLGIEGISTVGERIEDYSKSNQNEFSVVSARAVSSMAALLELAAPLMCKGGRLILMKSRKDEDFDEEKALGILGLRKLYSRDYDLETLSLNLVDADFGGIEGSEALRPDVMDAKEDRDDDIYRCIHVFEKVGPHRDGLPRRVGMAQKRPLVRASD